MSVYFQKYNKYKTYNTRPFVNQTLYVGYCYFLSLHVLWVLEDNTSLNKPKYTLVSNIEAREVSAVEIINIGNTDQGATNHQPKSNILACVRNILLSDSMIQNIDQLTTRATKDGEISMFSSGYSLDINIKYPKI